MGWLHRRRDRLERELERELRDHIELEAEDRGGDRYAARRTLGNALLIREHTRSEWPWMRVAAWLENLWHDVRHGIRVLVTAPGFTVVAVVSIACGTGANVAMFSVADALLLRPLPVPRPHELLVISAQDERGPAASASYPDYLDIREQNRSFDGVLAYLQRPAGVGISPEAPPLVRIVTLVSGNYFDVLDLQPAVGRWFRPDEDEVTGRDAVAVLSHGLWQKHYGGDPTVVGRAVRINGVEFTVIGVAPEGFQGLSTRGIAESVYVPFAMTRSLGVRGFQDVQLNRAKRWLGVRGRLRPGVDLDEARADLTRVGQNLARAYPDTNTSVRLIAQTELEARLGYSALDNGLLLLLTILSTAVLAVACANVAGLLASRAPLRAREISLRLALGAGRARLVRQLVTESLILALGGGLCGLAVAVATIAAFRQVQFPTDIVQVPTFQLDARALVFNLTVAVGSAFLFGVGPALHTTRLDLAGAIRSASPARARRWLPATRSFLVSVQVALSLVLVTLAVFSSQTFARVADTGPGFHTTGIAKITLDTQHRQYEPGETATFIDRALESARRLPGVTAASATSTMPLFDVATEVVVPDGLQADDLRLARDPIFAAIDEDYFETMGIPLLRGRSFDASDTADAPQVAIVNETLARRYWPNQSAIGRRVRLGSERGPALEVVGIARDSSYVYVTEPPQAAVYVPYRQQPRARVTLLARTAGDSAPAVAGLREIVHTLDAEMPVYDGQTMETYYEARATGILTVVAGVVGGMGTMGVLVTMVGLYALVAYSVRRRTREIGIRMAVGASAGQVLRMILRQGLRPAWPGLAAGVALSLSVARLLPAYLPTVARYEPLTYVVAVPTLLALTLVASFLPARSAALVDPVQALRTE